MTTVRVVVTVADTAPLSPGVTVTRIDEATGQHYQFTILRILSPTTVLARSDSIPPGMIFDTPLGVVYANADTTTLEVGGTITYAGVTGESREFTILSVVSPTRLLVDSSSAVPDMEYDIPVNTLYAKKVTTVSGLDHLEGATVSILADGAVHPTRVVQDGAVTLEYPAAVVKIGLAYTSDLKTLPLAMEGAQAAGQGTMKNINKVHLRVSQSSLVKAGPTFDRLREYPARAVTDNYGSPPALRDGELSLSIDPSWNSEGAVCVRQDQPLPLTLTSMTLEVQSGG